MSSAKKVQTPIDRLIDIVDRLAEAARSQEIEIINLKKSFSQEVTRLEIKLKSQSLDIARLENKLYRVTTNRLTNLNE